jgi:hypothetical protein
MLRCTRYPALGFAILLLASSHAVGASREKAEYSERISESIRRVVLQSLRTKASFASDDVMVSVSLEIDNDAVTTALQNAANQDPELASTARQVYEAVQNSITEAQNAAAPRVGDGAQTIRLPEGPRFGPLNLDVLAGKDIAIRESSPSRSQGAQAPAINLAIQLPPPRSGTTSFATLPPGTDLSPFVRAAEVVVSIPARFEAAVDQEVTALAQKALVNFLPQAVANQSRVEIKRLAPDAQTLQAERLEAALAEQANSPLRHLAANILDPRNPSLSGLLNSIALLIGMILASYGIWRAGLKLADAVGSLAPKTESEGSSMGGGGSARGIGGGDIDDAVRESMGDSRSKAGSKNATAVQSGVFQPDAEARALVNEMDRLRSGFVHAKNNDLLALSEALDDLVRQDGGPELALRCAVFVGEAEFDALIVLLSPKQSLTLYSYFSSQSHRAQQTLGGADACRMLLSHWNSRQIELRLLGDHELIVEARGALLEVDDANLVNWLQGHGGSPQGKWIFSALPPYRMLSVMRALPAEQAKVLGAALDQRQVNDTSAARAAIDVLRQVKASVSRHEQGRARLVQRLIANPTLADETLVSNLFDGPDWDLRRLVAQRCYLFSDLPYLEPSLLLSIIDKKKVADRAALLYLLPTELRETLIGSYPPGSKPLEVITLELANLDANPKRRASLLRSRAAVIEEFMQDLRRVLQTNESFVNGALRRMAASNGWPLPSDLNEPASADSMDESARAMTAA